MTSRAKRKPPADTEAPTGGALYYLAKNAMPVRAGDGGRPTGVTHYCREGDSAWRPIHELNPNESGGAP